MSVPAVTITRCRDPLRQFIDRAAEVQRAMGFQNEKDHPEVAPSQFEINYGYGEVVAAADQIQLYNLLLARWPRTWDVRQLPAQAGGGRQRQRHAHQRFGIKGKTNLFWDPKGEEKLSEFGWEFIDRMLTQRTDICLVLNPSVNAYRRLDPHFEAPNQIIASAMDRGSMVRVPIGNSTLHARGSALRRTRRQSLHDALLDLQDRHRWNAWQRSITCARRSVFCPTTFRMPSRISKLRQWITEIFGADVQERFVELKQASADRCPRTGDIREGL